MFHVIFHSTHLKWALFKALRAFYKPSTYFFANKYEFLGSGWVGYGIVLYIVVKVLEQNVCRRFLENLNLIK